VRLELNEVRMTFTGVASDAGRAEQVARLAFEYLAGMLGEWPAGGAGRGGDLGRLDLKPVSVSLDSESDDAAARAAAAEIYRAIVGALN